MADEATPIVIEQFDKALHDRSVFSCGFKPIDQFLKQGLTESIGRGLVAAFVAVEGETRPAPVIGYYTLSAFAVVADLAPELVGRHRAPTIPATYIKALAVDSTWQGRKIGTALLIDAVKRAARAARTVASSAIVLDILRDDDFDRRRTFYEALGFRPLGDPEVPDRYFIGMKDVRATLE